MRLRALPQCRITLLLSACAILLAGSGCGRYSHVNWLNPGTEDMQKRRALAEHDPYPDPDTGPEVVGGRPRGFTTPPPEPAWLQKRYQIQQQQSGVLVPSGQSYNLPPVYDPALNPAVVPQGSPVITGPNYTLPYQPAPTQPYNSQMVPAQSYPTPTQQLFPQQPLLPPRQ